MSVAILRFFDSLVDAVPMFLLSGRNRDYQDLTLTHAVNVMKYATILSFVPRPLKRCAIVLIHGPLSPPLRHISIVARMLSNLPSQIRQEVEFIRPMVEERFAKMEEFGDDWDKPVCKPHCTCIPLITAVKLQNDMLMWLMDEAKGVERSLEGVARRLLTVNFAAIHSTSQASDITIPQPLLCGPDHRIPADHHPSVISSPCQP